MLYFWTIWGQPYFRKSPTKHRYWLVVYLLPEKYECQLGLWKSQLHGKIKIQLPNQPCCDTRNILGSTIPYHQLWNHKHGPTRIPSGKHTNSYWKWPNMIVDLIWFNYKHLPQGISFTFQPITNHHNHHYNNDYNHHYNPLIFTGIPIFFA